MKTWNKDHLIDRLKKEGLVFSNFSLVHEGNYAVDDADWNYKDVPHLHYVHELVEAVYAAMQDEFIATINIQKVFGFRMPLCVFNYQSGKDEQTYYTSWLFFTLIVHTCYEKIAENKTRVITTYYVGSSTILKWCFPFIRYAIRKNYKNLMLADIPMRERRGKLRELGYQFYKSTESYSFPKTMEILEQNVIIRPVSLGQYTININDVLALDGEYFHGKDDHLGIRLVRQKNELFIFARMCLHEGASLDRGKCIGMKIQCPWHGRLHAPLAKFTVNDPMIQKVESKYCNLELSGNVLTVAEKNFITKPIACEEEVTI